MQFRQVAASPAAAFVASTPLALSSSRGTFSPGAGRCARRNDVRAARNLRAHSARGVGAVRAELTEGQQTALAAAGAVALPIVAWSEFVLGTTGCGLPPGPGGALGAAEGVSYLVVAGLVALSVKEKVTTGSGLPPGPGGLLGAAEGVAYLLVLAGLADAAYVFFKYGSVPEAVPGEASRCFPKE